MRLLKMSAAEFSPSIALNHPFSPMQNPGGPSPMWKEVDPTHRHPSRFVRRRYGAIDFEYVIRGILLFHRTWQGETWRWTGEKK